MDNMRRIGVLLIVLWASHPPTLNAQPVPADSARILLSRATELRAWGTPEENPEVLNLLRRAAELFRAAQDREGELLAAERLARVHADAMALDSALIYHRTALTLAREIGNIAAEAHIFEMIGRAQQQATRNDSALTYYMGAVRLYQEIGNSPAAVRTAARLQGIREARAVELLNSSPLLHATMGVIAGARHVQETRATLAGVPGFDPESITSVERSDEALEQFLSRQTVYAAVHSIPPGMLVRYRRLLDGPGQDMTVTTDERIPLPPALYLFSTTHPRTGRLLEQKVSCATHCNVVFNIDALP
jgi:tetratricopeptide (TPR) repeat protein